MQWRVIRYFGYIRFTDINIVRKQSINDQSYLATINRLINHSIRRSIQTRHKHGKQIYMMSSGKQQIWLPIRYINVRINTLRPGENGRHFPDDILKCILGTGKAASIIWAKVDHLLCTMTSSNGDISALLALCEGRPVTRYFDVFFDLCLNKRLSKQSRRRWFETPSRSL